MACRSYWDGLCALIAFGVYIEFELNLGSREMMKQLETFKQLCSRWAKRDDGVVAVEFSLIVMPLVTMILGIIEISLFFAASSTLQASTDAAARMVRTGQIAQAVGDPQEAFREKLCEFSKLLLDCNAIVFEVVPLAAGFAGADAIAPSYDADGNLVSGGFDAGAALEVVLIRVGYRYEFVTPLVGPILADGHGMSRMILSTVVLETEPYSHNF